MLLACSEAIRCLDEEAHGFLSYDNINMLRKVHSPRFNRCIEQLMRLCEKDPTAMTSWSLFREHKKKTLLG